MKRPGDSTATVASKKPPVLRQIGVEFADRPIERHPYLVGIPKVKEQSRILVPSDEISRFRQTPEDLQQLQAETVSPNRPLGSIHPYYTLTPEGKYTLAPNPNMMSNDREVLYQPFKTESNVVKQIEAKEIINMIYRYIRRVEGPITYTILRPTPTIENMLNRQGPVMLLFGDQHTQNRICDPPCLPEEDCYSFSSKSRQSILKLLSDKFVPDMQVDFFIEAWFDEYYASRYRQRLFNDVRLGSGSRVLQGTESTMTETEVAVTPCTYRVEGRKSSQCPFPLLNVHMTDPRSRAFNTGDGALNIFSVIPDLEESYFNKLVLKWFPRITPKEFLTLAVKKATIPYFQFFTQVFLKHRFFRLYSKLYKQFISLPLPLQNLIINKYIQYIPDDEMNNKPSLEPLNILSYVQSVDPTKSPFEFISEYYKTYSQDRSRWLGIDLTYDLYLLGRALKTPVDGLPSQLVVVYAGDSHIASLTNFLVHEGLYSLVAMNGGYEDSQGPIKCLELDKNKVYLGPYVRDSHGGLPTDPKILRSLYDSTGKFVVYDVSLKGTAGCNVDKPVRDRSQLQGRTLAVNSLDQLYRDSTEAQEEMKVFDLKFL